MALRKHWLRYLGGGLLFSLLLVLSLLYLRGAFRQEAEYGIENSPSLEDPRFPLAVIGLSNAIASQGRLTGFWVNADAIYAARLEAIRSAQRTILFETYYMSPGRRADEFAAALIERARAGVQVQLLVDDWGTSSMPTDYWEQLEAAGAEVQFFREFDPRAPLDYNSRTHRKLLLIDSRQALIGGAGVSDMWDGDPDQGDQAPWLEFEVRYEGTIVSLLEGKFFRNWAYMGGTVNLESALLPQEETSGGSQLFVTKNAPALSQSSMRMLFGLSFRAAQQRIWIASPYFLPEEDVRRKLIAARTEGVEVRVLTMGYRNDKPLVHYAARELYEDLLAAGVQICEYQPSMMHAKVALVDNSWVSTGSANFDPRSFMHNDELNISTSKSELVGRVETFLTQGLTDSHCLTYTEWQQRPFLEQVQGRLALIFHDLL